MEAIQLISQDLFDKIRSRFQNMEMGDKTGAVTLDPAEARFFDFDFVNEGTNLGRISISLNDIGALKIYYSQGITEGKDDLAKNLWFNFLKEMRQFAKRRLLRFDTRDVNKSNLDKNDFQYLASKQSSEEGPMNPTTMNESRWTKNTSKTSRRAVPNKTQVIVRHSESMAERRIGDRSNPKRIKAIYIENADGERFKYPFIHVAGAFAMAQHVSHGGVPHDPAGKAIIRMSENISQLQEFRKKVQISTLNDDAHGITERALGRLQELKVRVEALGKKTHYESWIAEFNETEHTDEMLSELDPVTFESYKSAFTQNNFNEELGKIFPLIHSIMQEKVNLEDYVTELKELQPITQDEYDSQKAALSKAQLSAEPGDKELRAALMQKMALLNARAKASNLKRSVEENGNIFKEFENWAEAVEQGTLSPEQIETLKTKLEDMEASGETLEFGPEASTAIAFFAEYGLNYENLPETQVEALEDKLKQDAEDAEYDETASPINSLKVWAKEHQPDLIAELGLEEPAPAEQPAAPVEQPAPAEQPAAAPAPQQPVAEDKQSSMIEEIAKLVKSRYNESNPKVGPFNGHEGILIEVEKTISEKFGEAAGAKARMIADRYMQKLTKEWEDRHGEKLMGENDLLNDELQRLKELVGNLKSKLEEKDVEEVHQKNFNPYDDLAGRGRISSIKKTDAGKKADFDRGTERLKDKMKFTQSQGGVTGPKGPLPEMSALKKLAGLKK